MSARRGVNQRSKFSILTVSPAYATEPSRSNLRIISTLYRIFVSGFAYGTPCSGSTWTLWLDPIPNMKRPSDKSSTVADAIAMVGIERTKILVIAVPSVTRDVRTAQAERVAN